jgi:hypothetical protein
MPKCIDIMILQEVSSDSCRPPNILGQLKRSQFGYADAAVVLKLRPRRRVLGMAAAISVTGGNTLRIGAFVHLTQMLLIEPIG